MNLALGSGHSHLITPGLSCGIIGSVYSIGSSVGVIPNRMDGGVVKKKRGESGTKYLLSLLLDGYGLAAERD